MNIPRETEQRDSANRTPEPCELNSPARNITHLSPPFCTLLFALFEVSCSAIDSNCTSLYYYTEKMIALKDILLFWGYV